MSKKTLTITDNRNGNLYEFDIKKGSCGPDVADLTSFYERTGMFVYDPGFKSTASFTSDIVDAPVARIIGLPDFERCSNKL